MDDDDRRWRLLSLPVIGWILYDFANTIFSFVVVTRYYNDWIIEERGQPDIYVGLMVASVSVVLILLLPLLGALADRLGRHKPILIAFTLLSVVATGLLGVIDSILLALVVAAIATIGFNSSDSQYHPMLSVVAPEARRGRVSGIGVAIGYLGSLMALFVIGAMVDDGEAQKAFLPAAAMFLVFAIPCFVLVRERPKPPPDPDAQAPPRPFAQLAATVRRARGAPHGRMLLARFFYVDAIATVLTYLTVYARRTGDFDGDSIDQVLALSAVAGIIGAVGGGVLAERFGPKRVIQGTLVVAVGSLLVEAVTGSGELLWVVGPLLGIVLGSLSAVDRVFLLRLIPPERRGEDFGLYALVGKLSTGFGPLVLWGGTILVAHNLVGLSTPAGSRWSCSPAPRSSAGSSCARCRTPRCTTPRRPSRCSRYRHVLASTGGIASDVTGRSGPQLLSSEPKATHAHTENRGPSWRASDRQPPPSRRPQHHANALPARSRAPRRRRWPTARR